MPRRRADWLIGRITAKSVVAETLEEAVPGGWPLRAIEIPSQPNGMPYARLAPEAGPVERFAPGERLPISVSISHAEEHALCAATLSGPGEDGSRRTLGVDLGLVEPRSGGFVATFFTPEEQRFVRDAPAGQRELRANLVWCAKEAALKALGLGLTVDTLDLCCLPVPGRADPAEWPLAPADDGWRPFAVRCSPALVPGGGEIRGIWRSFPRFVGALAVHAAPSRLEGDDGPSRPGGGGRGLRLRALAIGSVAGGRPPLRQRLRGCRVERSQVEVALRDRDLDARAAEAGVDLDHHVAGELLPAVEVRGPEAERELHRALAEPEEEGDGLRRLQHPGAPADRGEEQVDDLPGR